MLAISALFALSPAAAQVSLTTLGTPYTQNFDTLPATGSATWTSNTTIPGWYHARTGTGTTVVANDGASNAGNLYSYGTGTTTERALGSLGSGNAAAGNMFWGVRLQNNTGSTITSLNISYTGEQWRNSAAAAAQTAAFSYLVGSPTVTGSLAEFQSAGVAVTALDFTSPITGGTAGALNGNLAANRTALTFNITGLSIPNGTEFMLRWSDPDQTGADHGLAIDDFSVTPNAGAPLPNLSINDVSLTEGNAGTTSFTFTVSLSAPAGAGGVTFDIATANNTAVAPGDYTSNTLLSQTIPAGSSTYSFTVLVNGDTTPETNETFFVNVTNATGATVTDGQGQGTIVNDDAAPNLTINDVSLNEGNAGTTTFTFTVSLSAPAPAGGVTFDIATANSTAVAPGDYTATSLVGQTIPAGSSTYTFNVLVNGDTTPELDETFFVNITNVTNAILTDGQGLGTIVNDDITFIHDVQGNGAATPIPGATVTVEGIVVGNYQGTTRLSGFFLQEEDTDADADPNTSEGIFIYCNTCPTAVAEGQRVRVTGTVSEFFNMTQITASTAGSVVVTNAGNNLALVAPTVIALPIAGDVNAFYEAREGMRVTFSSTLTVSEYFELARYGTIDLYQGGRPMQFTETNAPSVAGNAAYAAALAARRIILDDDNDTENVSTTQTDGQQFIYHPRANGGFSVGTQGTDFFRGGDLVNGLTGVLHWSFSGGSSPSAWRIRPTAATPVTFTVANPRPVTPPAVGGAIKAVSMNMLNYFTTIDTTASNSTGPCAPGGTLDCRGADSVAELNRQRERASIVICSLNAHVYALMEMENTAPSATVTDLLGAVNTRCGGANPFASVNTGGTLGTDAIRLNIIYRSGVLSPVGAPLVDLDPIHSRPPLAQTFDVVDAANPAFGQRFTVIGNHLKSKGSSAGLPGDVDSGDGQGASSATRTAQAARLVSWTNGTVVPAAGDPDVLLLGDFNSYAMEPPIATITAGGYTDLAASLLGAGTYSYVFDGQLGHLDYAFSSSSLTPQVTGVGVWHINADESDLFDYNDEVRDSPGEATFEEKPDGSALVPPRVVFQPASPYRASDHDPVLVGLFLTADLGITKTDSPDPVTAGTNLTYTITVSNAGPDVASTTSWSDTLPAGTTFVSLPAVAGWSCTTPAIGAGGTVSCSNASFAVGSAVFTLTTAVASSVTAGTVLSNTATVTSATGDGNTGNNSATATTTVSAIADLSITKTDSPDPVGAGNTLTYTITVSNAGPSVAASASMTDTLPVGTTFASLTSPGGWSCTFPAVGSGGTVACSTLGTMPIASSAFTLVVTVSPAAASGSTITNTATVSSPTTDPAPGNNSATATTSVVVAAMSPAFTVVPTSVAPGQSLTGLMLVCTNTGASIANSPTCVPSANVGTVSAISCSPASPPTLAGGASMTCTFSYLAPGTTGGGDEGSTSVIFTGSTSASNANGGAPSTATATAQVIDALNDAPAAVQNNIANSVNLIANDTVGSGTATASGMGNNVAVSANGAVTCGTCVGTPTTLTVAADGTVSIPALAVAGTYLVPYQICALPSNPMPLAAACDTAVATIIVQGADMVSSISCTPTTGAPGTTVNCTATCTNNGPAAAVNAVCTILNVASLPAGASAPVCTGSPAATLAAGATLTCTVSFPMPATSGTITVSAGAAADNDPLGGSDPAAVVNNASAVSLGALLEVLPVPTISGAALGLLSLLLMATVALRRKRLR